MSPARLRHLAAAGLFAAAVGARADEWAIEPSVTGRLSYNDNVMMRSDDKQADTYLTITPALALANRTESHDIGLNLSVGGNWYQNRSEYDATDYSARLASKWLVELDQWNLAVGSLRDSTLQSELASTGVVTSRRQRTLDSIHGGWTHTFGESWSGNLGYSAFRATYQSAPDLVDYDDQIVSAGIGKSISERVSLSLSLSSRDYRTRDDKVRSQVDSVSLGGQWQYSERFGFGISVGRQSTDSEQKYDAGCVVSGVFLICFPAGTIRSESNGTTYSGNVGYQFDQSSFSLGLSRGLTASGTGALLRTDSAGLAYSHRFDEILSLNVGASQTRSRYFDNPDADSRYSSLSCSLGWQIDERATLGVGYSHSSQRTASQATTARGNLVFMTLNWNFVPLLYRR